MLFFLMKIQLFVSDGYWETEFQVVPPEIWNQTMIDEL